MFGKLSTVRALMLAAGLGLMAQGCGGEAAVDDDEAVTGSSEQAMRMSLDFTCGPTRCTCTGGEDCNDMFASGVCSVGPGTGCSELSCWCKRN